MEARDKLQEPKELTRDMYFDCTCEIYKWSDGFCPHCAMKHKIDKIYRDALFGRGKNNGS